MIDLVDAPKQWFAWSQRTLVGAALIDRLVINHVVLAELSTRPETSRSYDRVIQTFEIEIVGLDDRAARRAGEAFGRYRRRGGTRTSVLADFLIGGHCASLGATLLTRDAARFAGYFPELTLIAPETAP